MARKEIKIEVPVLARVEGEGALEIDIADGVIRHLHLRIYEPPRFFEKFLEGRAMQEVPDIVARICGICPVAYQMSAVQALENILQLKPSPWIRAMRRLLYCGEWIESHALHIHLLAAPDFLGFDSAIAMADKYPDEVRRGLQLQHLGNRIIALLGGRAVHPVGVCVGGFYHAPTATETQQLLADLKSALPEAEALLRWTLQLELPDDEQDFVCVAMRHESEYPMNEGRIVSSGGLDISVDEYPQHFRESHAPHSTALYSHLHGKPYLVGPLARLNLNLERLPPPIVNLLHDAGMRLPSQNMFHSIIARAVEIYYAMLEAIRLLEAYAYTDSPGLAYTLREGAGAGCTEAPRGILWHRYEMDKAGIIRAATIIPPTSQNQARIEQDLANALQKVGLDKAADVLRLHGEKVIRNYDPCISCATHFLKLKLTRD